MRISRWLISAAFVCVVGAGLACTQNAADQPTNTASATALDEAEKGVDTAPDATKEGANKALDATREGAATVIDETGEALETTANVTKNVAQKTGEKTKEIVVKMADKTTQIAGEVGQKTKEIVSAAGKVKEAMGEIRMRAPARLFAAFGVSLLVASAAVGTVVVTARRAGPRADGLTRAQADELVRAHNAWRQRVGVLSLRWAPDLAARAQARAEYLAAHGCVIEHGLLPEDVGENLYHVGPLRAEGRKDELFVVTATQVVDAWGAESANYSPVHGTCAWNRQCGHYTQIVWTTTGEVGCGMSVCPTLGQVWVCNYRPKGNIIVQHE